MTFEKNFKFAKVKYHISNKYCNVRQEVINLMTVCTKTLIQNPKVIALHACLPIFSSLVLSKNCVLFKSCCFYGPSQITSFSPLLFFTSSIGFLFFVFPMYIHNHKQTLFCPITRLKVEDKH